MALDNASVNLPEKKFVAITGKSGSGKTTLLNLLGLIDTPDKGTVLIGNKNIFEFSNSEKLEYRRNTIGIVFQFFQLIPVLNVYENIVLANEHSKKYEKEYFEEITNKLGISKILRKYPDQLSGGQKQRVAIARAIINRPKILLADEPTGNLDSETSKEVIDLLKNIAHDYEMTILMVTHDDDIAKEADMNIHIVDGKIGD